MQENKENIWQDENLIKTLSKNSVVIMPTDTIYGIVGKALNKEVVERIYKIRKRSPEKPCIILIGSIDELQKFSVKLTDGQKQVLEKYWSLGFTENFRLEPVSIILDCNDDNLEYLHRGTNTLAFRLPISKILQNFLLQTGPLIAPSANTEGNPPSKNIIEAKNYFGNSVGLYIDGGEIETKASKLIKLNSDNSVTVLRE